MKKRLVLVTGCARSGTLYISKVLKKAGLKVGHEYVDEDGTASHFFASPVPLDMPLIKSKAPKGRCIHVGEQRRDFEFAHVFHQVRNPLKVISSLRWTGVRADHLEAACGVDTSKVGRVHRALIYWVLWNELIENQKPELRYRIEDIDTVFPKLLELMGRPSGFGDARVPDVPRDTHSSWRWSTPWAAMAEDAKGRKVRMPYKERKRMVQSTPDVTWEQLRSVDPEYTERAIGLARRYGY